MGLVTVQKDSRVELERAPFNARHLCRVAVGQSHMWTSTSVTR